MSQNPSMLTLPEEAADARPGRLRSEPSDSPSMERKSLSRPRTRSLTARLGSMMGRGHEGDGSALAQLQSQFVSNEHDVLQIFRGDQPLGKDTFHIVVAAETTVGEIKRYLRGSWAWMKSWEQLGLLCEVSVDGAGGDALARV